MEVPRVVAISSALTMIPVPAPMSSALPLATSPAPAKVDSEISKSIVSVPDVPVTVRLVPVTVRVSVSVEESATGEVPAGVLIVSKLLTEPPPQACQASSAPPPVSEVRQNSSVAVPCVAKSPSATVPSKISVPEIDPVGSTTSASPVPSVVMVREERDALPIVRAPAETGVMLPPAVIVRPPEFTKPAKFSAPPVSTGMLLPVGVCAGVNPPTVLALIAYPEETILWRGDKLSSEPKVTPAQEPGAAPVLFSTSILR